jgi:hypothetical protein
MRCFFSIHLVQLYQLIFTSRCDIYFWCFISGLPKKYIEPGDPACVITAISNMWDYPWGILISCMFEVQIIIIFVSSEEVSSWCDKISHSIQRDHLISILCLFSGYALQPPRWFAMPEGSINKPPKVCQFIKRAEQPMNSWKSLQNQEPSAYS